MKLTRLYELHEKYKDQGLDGNFGDGYLMVHNSLYRSVRKAALSLGYRFSNERDEAYETFPLLQLERLLETKQFTYSNNVLVVKGMSPDQRAVLAWEDIDGNLKKNFLFHEGCHGVVRTLALGVLGPVNRTPDLDGERRMVLRMLLEESCANACEFLGVAEASEPTHRIFYEMNSYVSEFKNRTHLKKTITDMGLKSVLKFMILCYLHSNFLRDGLDDRAFKEVNSFTGFGELTAKDLKTLRALSKIAFQLSERFRVQTTSFHLRLASIHTPLDELSDFHFLFSLEKQKSVEKFFDSFLSLIETSAQL